VYHHSVAASFQLTLPIGDIYTDPQEIIEALDKDQSAAGWVWMVSGHSGWHHTSLLTVSGRLGRWCMVVMTLWCSAEPSRWLERSWWTRGHVTCGSSGRCRAT